MKILSILPLVLIFNTVLCHNLEQEVTFEKISPDEFIRGSDDQFKTFQQIANENGFRVEVYQVVTYDGYILQVYRIPGKLTETDRSDAPKPAILLQHALVMDMMVWIMNEPEVAPAFFLAERGFDVWLGNNRGNRFSDKHVSLDNKAREYWQFDWEQMGTYDQPAVISFILKTTGLKKISYMGHSQGTTQLVAGAALLPEYYNQRIDIAVLLAPPISMYYNPSDTLRNLAKPISLNLIMWSLDQIKFWNIIPYDFIQAKSSEILCSILDGKICDLIIDAVSEWHSINNKDRKKMYVSNMPSGASARNYAHYGQLVHLSSPSF